MVGRKAFGGRRAPPLRHWTSLRFGWLISSSVAHIRQEGEFGFDLCPGAFLEVTETSLYGFWNLLPSALRGDILNSRLSHYESLVSLTQTHIHWFSLHEWLCISQWSIMYSAVTQHRFGVVSVGYNTIVVAIVVVISLLPSLLVLPLFSV